MTHSERSLIEEELAALWLIAASVSDGWVSIAAWILCVMAVIPAVAHAVRAVIGRTIRTTAPAEGQDTEVL